MGERGESEGREGVGGRVYFFVVFCLKSTCLIGLFVTFLLLTLRWGLCLLSGRLDTRSAHHPAEKVLGSGF